MPLAGAASLAGVSIPSLYGDAPLAPAIRGQDLLTLMILPALVAALAGTSRASARATVVWLGLLGYLLYTYTGAAFAYRFNRFFLVYVALFTLTAVALCAGALGANVAQLHHRFDARTPRRALAVFLIATAGLLIVSELGQIVPALVKGTVPALVARSDGAGNFVYVLDLGVIVPLIALAAWGLRRRAAWADLLGGCLALKTTTMGLALLAMTWFSVRARQPAEVGLTAAYAAMTAAGMAMTIWFLSHERTGPWRQESVGRSTGASHGSAFHSDTSS
ncbi:MAG TPA: hypothetical protein VN903_03285 [Polyangia bacterium]|nr:hypothetical protein [Polyangia bacterium]